jgi:adenylate cyclase class 2
LNNRVALEQEVKLAFDTIEAARLAVMTAGGRLVVSRRLLDDRLFDTDDQRLRTSGCAFRIRRDGTTTLLTFKGPGRPGPVKSREEIETPVGSPEAAEALLAALGLRQWFRGEKYREEYTVGPTTVTVDDTPIGVFIEIEGEVAAIARVAALLGRTPADYRLESYPRLHFEWCTARGVRPGDMLFAR